MSIHMTKQDTAPSVNDTFVYDGNWLYMKDDVENKRYRVYVKTYYTDSNHLISYNDIMSMKTLFTQIRPTTTPDNKKAAIVDASKNYVNYLSSHILGTPTDKSPEFSRAMDKLRSIINSGIAQSKASVMRRIYIVYDTKTGNYAASVWHKNHRRNGRVNLRPIIFAYHRMRTSPIGSKFRGNTDYNDGKGLVPTHMCDFSDELFKTVLPSIEEKRSFRVVGT